MTYLNIIKSLLESLPEIQGAFVYSNKRGVLCSEERQTTNDLQKETIGKAFSTVFSLMSIHFNDIDCIRFNYMKMDLFGGRFNETDFLVVLSGHDVSAGMIKISIRMALQNLEEATDSTVQIESDEPEPTVINPEELMGPDSPLAPHLTLIQQELAKHFGPVANVLYQKALTTWTQQTTPTRDTLSDLVDILVKEVGEEEEGEEFRVAANKHL